MSYQRKQSRKITNTLIAKPTYTRENSNTPMIDTKANNKKNRITSAEKTNDYSMEDLNREVSFIMARCPINSELKNNKPIHKVYGCTYSWDMKFKDDTTLILLHLFIKGRPVLSIECPISHDDNYMERFERLCTMYYALFGPVANRLVYNPDSKHWTLFRNGSPYDIEQQDISAPEE